MKIDIGEDFMLMQFESKAEKAAWANFCGYDGAMSDKFADMSYGGDRNRPEVIALKESLRKMWPALAKWRRL